MKWLHYHQTLASLYFWRTYTGTEIDIVEEREGGIHVYECKWSRPAGRASRVPESFPATPTAPSTTGGSPFRLTNTDEATEPKLVSLTTCTARKGEYNPVIIESRAPVARQLVDSANDVQLDFIDFARSAGALVTCGCAWRGS